MKTLAIIGSAGRKDDAARVSGGLYEDMVRAALDVTREHGIARAVSGGAAFADHVAVSLYLRGAVSELLLYLPARFDDEGFVPGGRGRADAARTANRYHRHFRDAAGVDGLAELAEAIRRGAKAEVLDGFKRRNLEVASSCTHMIAFTFGRGEAMEFGPDSDGFSSASTAGLKDGGTAHTWGQCWKAEWKKHVNLFNLLPTPAPVARR